MKDINSLIKAVDLIPPNVYVADPVPLVVDLVDFEAADIVLQIGAGGIAFDATNKIDFKLLHSDDGVNFEAVNDGDLIGSPAGAAGGVIKTLATAHATPSVEQFGYRGGRRYIELLPDFSGVHGTGTPIAAVVIKGRPHQTI